MEFQAGDTVICVNHVGWHDEETKIKTKGPEFKQILKVFNVSGNYLSFKEFNNEDYHSKGFVRIDGYTNETKVIKEITKIIKEIKKQDTHKEQMPHSPQTS